MEDDNPSPFIKKRKQLRPSGSTSSLRSIGANSPSTSKLSFGAEEEEDDDGAGNVAVMRNKGKKTPAGRLREASTKGKEGRLSFGGGDEEADSDAPSEIKRSTPSSTSRRLLRPTLVQSASSSSLANAAAPVPAEAAPSTRSVYSKEYLDELKAGQLVAPRGGAVAEGAGEREGYDALTKSKFGADQLDDSASIPTTNAIARAKARREEMRKAGLTGSQAGGDGFIPLEVGFANKGGDSRLVREEDEIGDGDEDMAAFTGALEKIPLGKKANKEAAVRMRTEMGEMIDDVEMDVAEEDEEMRRWEVEQIRRGGEGRRAREERKVNLPQAATLSSLSAVTSRLAAALSTLTASHAVDASSLTHFEHERADLDTQEKELREEVVKVEEKSRWFGEFKETVEDWAAFLDEKYPQLEKIEAEYLAIQKERFDIVSRRRFADDSDDVALFTGSPVPSMPSAAPRIADEEIFSEPSADAEPRSIIRSTRRVERERRFLERSSASSSSSGFADPLPDAGYATDSSLSSSEASDLADALSSLRDQLASLFADVKADDYRDPNLGIRRKFEEWRERFREEYEMTFGGLAMVGVWEFWARVEMAGWNPFEIDELPRTPSDLSQYAWHQALTTYGHRQDPEDENFAEDQPDESTEVVNALVTSVVIPRLEKLARASYDPFSSRQTVAAIKVFDEVSYCVDKSSPRFESLLHAFLHRLRLSISHAQSLLLPYASQLTLPSLAFDPSTFTARQHFLSRQLKLVRACMRWRRFMRSLRVPSTVGEDGIEMGAGATFDELVQGELIGRVVLPVAEAAWATGGEEIARKVLDALPKDVPPALKRRLEGEAVQ
ncbi:SPOSA6832_01682 [Sporobolomyces salmonicolor]|uniref:SPOSA6832_01682-mRNA-1:cds n=1 Tax=Sporidiobolus salmonicolor TaxID=5005 RepID=A0A0D6EKE8_SPOSA|nr:SPOSA6832_01682 [Sporobolomyces salmonicolor]